MFWLVLSRSGFCSTDRFHGKGSTRVFLFWSEAHKFKICYQISEKKKQLWILSFFIVKLPEEAKKIENFPKDGWRRRTFSKRVLLSWRSGNFWSRNWNRHHRVPYNKLLTNLVWSGHTEKYWPSVVFVQTSLSSVRTVTSSGQYSLVRPSRSVSDRLSFPVTSWLSDSLTVVPLHTNIFFETV